MQIPGDFDRQSREAMADGPLEIPDATWELFLEAAASVDIPRSDVEAVRAS